MKMRMNRRIRWRIVVLNALALGAVSCGRTRMQTYIHNDIAGAATADWMARTCLVGEDNHLEDRLLLDRAEVERFFLDVLKNGPDPKIVSDVEAAANHRFLERQRLLATGSYLGLSDADIQAARSLTRDEYLAQQRDDFVIRYKAQAVTGLGLLGGPAARAALEAIAADARSPLNGNAAAALRQLK